MTVRKKNLKKLATQFPSNDPLYRIFEQHLYDFEDGSTDRKTFIGNIVKDYIKCLSKSSRTIAPYHLEDCVQELFEEVNTMLLKKIYGFSTVEQFRTKNPRPSRQKNTSPAKVKVR